MTYTHNAFLCVLIFDFLVSAGGPDCFDIQIQTTDGLKAIRMRAIAGTSAASTILQTLQATAEVPPPPPPSACLHYFLTTDGPPDHLPFPSNSHGVAFCCFGKRNCRDSLLVWRRALPARLRPRPNTLHPLHSRSSSSRALRKATRPLSLPGSLTCAAAAPAAPTEPPSGTAQGACRSDPPVRATCSLPFKGSSVSHCGAECLPFQAAPSTEPPGCLQAPQGLSVRQGESGPTETSGRRHPAEG